jgi:hypothetical protein
MADVATIRTGLATNLATISGLRTSAWVPDQINPPIAVIKPETINYDTAFKRGLDTYEFSVLVIVGRVDERSAQSRLDAYCASSGATSIKTAIESDRDLNGAISDLRVTEMRNYTSLPVGDVTYLAAEFVVQVFAQ